MHGQKTGQPPTHTELRNELLHHVTCCCRVEEGHSLHQMPSDCYRGGGECGEGNGMSHKRGKTKPGKGFESQISQGGSESLWLSSECRIMKCRHFMLWRSLSQQQCVLAKCRLFFKKSCCPSLFRTYLAEDQCLAALCTVESTVRTRDTVRESQQSV